MKVILRLYRQHDLDLLYLHKSKEFSMQKNVKLALKSYVNNNPIEIKIPDDIFIEKKLPKVSQFHIVLSDKYDNDIIQWLNTISKGYRNSLIKNILRHYMSNLMIAPYLIENSEKIHPNKQESKEEIIAKGRRAAKEVLNTPAQYDDHNIKQEIQKSDANDFHKNVNENSPEEEPGFDLFDEFDSMVNNF